MATAPAPPTLAIIGAGAAGRDFALLCATAGFRVVLEDVMPAKLRRAEQEFDSLGRAVTLASTVEDAVRDADVAVDFVPDELESKLEIWSLIDRMAPPKTILLTPSASLSITDLASCTYRVDRCLMMRGSLSPGGRIRLLQPRQASAEAIATGLSCLRQLGFEAEAEHDPDLPMLLKNMNAAHL